MKIKRVYEDNTVTLISDTGKEYDVNMNYPLSCSCPHFQHRLKSSGVLCKHINYLLRWLGSEEVNENEKELDND